MPTYIVDTSWREAIACPQRGSLCLHKSSLVVALVVAGSYSSSTSGSSSSSLPRGRSRTGGGHRSSNVDGSTNEGCNTYIGHCVVLLMFDYEK